MKSKLFLIVSIALLFGPAGSAAEMTADLGPYAATFSLPSDLGCSIDPTEEVGRKTAGGIDYVERSVRLDCDCGRVLMKVTSYSDPVPAGDRETRALSRKAPWTMAYMNVETKEKLVDRQTGLHSTFQQVSGGEVHQVAYWLDRYLAPGDYLGKTSCVISSSLPSPATKELFDTFQLAKKAEGADRPSTMETVTAGRYAVSFDLGDLNYTFTGSPAHQEDGDIGLENYRIVLDEATRAATIEITGYDGLRMVNLGTEKLLAEAHLRTKGYIGNNVSEWTVGESPAVLGVGEDRDHQILYVAIFWPDQVVTDEGQTMGTTRCLVESGLRWDPTERLLSTLRVERREDL